MCLYSLSYMQYNLEECLPVHDFPTRSLDCKLQLGEMRHPTPSLAVRLKLDLPLTERQPLERELVLVPAVEVAEEPHLLRTQFIPFSALLSRSCNISMKFLPERQGSTACRQTCCRRRLCIPCSCTTRKTCRRRPRLCRGARGSPRSFRTSA